MFKMLIVSKIFCFLQFVFEDQSSSYEQLLDKAKMPSLHIRIKRTMAIDTFKIIYIIASGSLQDLLNIYIYTIFTKYTFRYSNILEIPQVRNTRYGKMSFRFVAKYSVEQLSEPFQD